MSLCERGAGVEACDYYRTGRASLETVRILCQDATQNQVRFADRRKGMLGMIQATLEDLPDSENAFIRRQMGQGNRMFTR